MCANKLYFVFFTLLTVCEYSKVKAFRVFSQNGVETILALERENVNIQCTSDMAMAYCGFLHPTGKRYAFTGPELKAGKCSISIKAGRNDSGEWRCHIGTQSAGVEVMKIIHLKIVGEVAAVNTNISTTHGKSRTLYCTTTRGFTPLKYCRFEPPNGLPFSIDDSVTEDKPLLNRYYYPTNKSLDRGDCAVTIRKVKYEDVGRWTCGAGFSDGKEHIDIIYLDVEGLYTMSTASATGITFGAIGIIALVTILGFIVWKKRRFLGILRPEAAMESQELEEMPAGPARSPRPTPREGRRIPLVTVESPSQQSEPGTTSPLMAAEEEH